jgi:hypothetical protein
MATHDYVIDNQSASAFRADLNSVLQAILTQNSSATAPTTATANMIWYDTANNQIKKRNEAGSAWITLGTIDEALGTFTPSGAGTIASQAEAEAGTNNTNLMTPLRTAQAIAALAGLQNIAVRTATGSFTIPTGVTELYVLAVAGGGGGGGGYTSGTRNPTIRTGGDGGHGAEAISYLTGQTPGATISYTIGAGGAGNNSGTGSTGGTTSTGAISCTGGVGGTAASSTQAGTTGADGTATGANVSNNVVFSSIWGTLPVGTPLVEDSIIFSGQNFNRPPATSSTAAIAYSATGANQPGAGGGPETGSSVNASGGVGGCVIFIY